MGVVQCTYNLCSCTCRSQVPCKCLVELFLILSFNPEVHLSSVSRI